jgi:SAM-dependent methyltransferase
VAVAHGAVTGTVVPRTGTEVLAELVPLAGKRVIDVGAGSGELVRWLRSQGADVTGVECGEVMLRLAHEADPEHPEAYVDGVAQALPLPDDSADVVVFSYSLHHVPAEHHDEALREAARVLHDDGVLYVVEPVAAGPGHEVIRIIDDETEVRALAQAALTRAGAAGFEPLTTTGFVSRMRLPSAEALASRVVGVDPSRAARMAERRDEFLARFAELATPDGDSFCFDQENRVAVFRRTRRVAG